MEISATQVRELREKTGVGMMECKKALQESQGDMEKAVLWLRERGLSRAAKKAGRVTAEGLVHYILNDERTAASIVEINCETDFVAKNDEFIGFVREFAEKTLKHRPKDGEALRALPVGGTTADARLTDMVSRIGENMQIRRGEVIDSQGGRVGGYIHQGGKIAAVVAVSGKIDGQTDQVLHDLCMHVAASAPKYLTSQDVATAELEQERAIARKKLQEEGKPAALVDKILEGQMKKFYKDVCFVEQPFVKDPNLTVAQYASKAGLTITSFVRYGLGEGIEKKKEDFASEVAAQLS